MEALDAILTRRSIRRFNNHEIPEEKIRKILEAGMSAPSAMDKRPWHFIIIKNKNALEDMSRLSTHSFMIKEASLAILVCGDMDIETIESYLIQGCSAATTNILLAAHSLGLGAVWVGIYPRKDRVETIRTRLALPQSILPLCIIPIGHPAEQKPPQNKYDPTKTHEGKW
jgi:nitroreductase